MQSAKVVAFCAILGLVYGLDDLSFPPGFKFGVASSSYQVEGAWNVSDKSESIWDRYSHLYPHEMIDRSNGDLACNSYYLWERDIQMVKEVGAHNYRFSLSWPRILPKGFDNKISDDGVKYYNQLINGLLENGIEPIVTLYHWDLPQSLQDLGGWVNPLIVDWFADYARVVYTLFGDRVKTWITVNEPIVFCDWVYNSGVFAPGIFNNDVAPYVCNKHLLLAHATAYRIYDEEFRPKYNGLVSLANQVLWMEPSEPEHEELAYLAMLNVEGRYSHAIYSKEGGWPPALEKAIEAKSKEEGYLKSKLPKFTQEEIEYIKGTYDFYGLNYYTSRAIRPAKEGEELLPWPLGDAPDLNAKLFRLEEWPATWSSIIYENPLGFRKVLSWLKEHYGDIPILITENGYPDSGGLEDHSRIQYYKDHMEQILLSIKEDGINVTGFTAWTLMDAFEWTDGYTTKMGLYEVDFLSPERTRTPRASAFFYSKVIEKHSLDVDEA